MQFRHPNIIDILGKVVSCPFLLTIQCREDKLVDCMTIEGNLVSFDHEVVTVDSHRLVIVRDGKGENLSMQLFLALHRLEKFDKSFDGDGHAVRVLAIGNVESGTT